MEIELLLLPLMVSFILFKHISAGLHIIDDNVNYNNSQDDFAVPPKWAKKLFKLKSTLLPKYICCRFYSAFLVLLAPICIILYLLTENKPLIMILIQIQVVYIIVDTICIQIYLQFYKKKRKMNTGEKEKTRDHGVS